MLVLAFRVVYVSGFRVKVYTCDDGRGVRKEFCEGITCSKELGLGLELVLYMR